MEDPHNLNNSTSSSSGIGSSTSSRDQRGGQQNHLLSLGGPTPSQTVDPNHNLNHSSDVTDGRLLSFQQHSTASFHGNFFPPQQHPYDTDFRSPMYHPNPYGMYPHPSNPYYGPGVGLHQGSVTNSADRSSSPSALNASAMTTSNNPTSAMDINVTMGYHGSTPRSYSNGPPPPTSTTARTHRTASPLPYYHPSPHPPSYYPGGMQMHESFASSPSSPTAATTQPHPYNRMFGASISTAVTTDAGIHMSSSSTRSNRGHYDPSYSIPNDKRDTIETTVATTTNPTTVRELSSPENVSHHDQNRIHEGIAKEQHYSYQPSTSSYIQDDGDSMSNTFHANRTPHSANHTAQDKSPEDESDDDPYEDSDTNYHFVDYNKLEPMRSDFYFYAQQYKDSYLSKIEASWTDSQSHPNTSSPSTTETKDPFVLHTLLNEYTLRKWEEEPETVRATFLSYEEEDRKRFMLEDEVMNQHCDTLTARSKSTKTENPMSSTKETSCLSESQTSPQELHQEHNMYPPTNFRSFPEEDLYGRSDRESSLERQQQRKEEEEENDEDGNESEDGQGPKPKEQRVRKRNYTVSSSDPALLMMMTMKHSKTNEDGTFYHNSEMKRFRSNSYTSERNPSERHDSYYDGNNRVRQDTERQVYYHENDSTQNDDVVEAEAQVII